MAIDYSRWKDIEISDDEDDTHPNIDTPSLFRWRHKARLERMAEMKEEKEKVEGGKKEVLSRVQEIEEKLSNTNLDEKERIKLELERDNIRKQEEEYLRKEKELADKERLAPWNIDTIGKETWSRTIVNKVPKDKTSVKDPSSPSVSAQPKLSEDEEHRRLLDYFSKNETLLGEMSLLKGFDAMEEEVQSFKDRLRKRARDKREAYVAEAEASDKAKRVEASPGGLDPIEVLESLPEALREAFESQSMDKMFKVAETMDREVFNYHLQRCIDSGLWIPNAKEHEEKMAKEKEKEEEGIIPTKDVIKRMAIVDGCNVLHLCAGMGLHSRAEQQMFDQKKPDAIGLLLVVKKLFEEDFDVRIFISFSYMSENKVSNLFILQEFKSLGILTVVPPNVHDDIAILEYASQG
uniref:Hsp90 chaperone protein kinase-targeting subunit n=1 Tax=Meloidogyne javanica TaxID=6303 RepID=A0A915LUV7_MELJA